jgi:hypothetical protein
MQEAHSANMHGWLQQGSSCSLATHLKLTIDIDKVIPGLRGRCGSGGEACGVVVGGVRKEGPEGTTDRG